MLQSILQCLSYDEHQISLIVFQFPDLPHPSNNIEMALATATSNDDKASMSPLILKPNE